MRGPLRQTQTQREQLLYWVCVPMPLFSCAQNLALSLLLGNREEEDGSNPKINADDSLERKEGGKRNRARRGRRGGGTNGETDITLKKENDRRKASLSNREKHQTSNMTPHHDHEGFDESFQAWDSRSAAFSRTGVVPCMENSARRKPSKAMRLRSR
jgi:hypothetical protein